MRKRKKRMLDDFPDLEWLGQYILGGEDGHTPVPCYSLHKWGRWLEEKVEHRSLWWTGNETKWVSTVFLGLDHQHWRGPPLLFETMAFVHEGRMMDLGNGPQPVPETLCQERYSSWDDAEIGHRSAVRKYLVNQKTRAVKAE